MTKNDAEFTGRDPKTGERLPDVDPTDTAFYADSKEDTKEADSALSQFNYYSDFNCSVNLDQFLPAFIAAQRGIMGAAADSQNTHFKSKYADLSSVWKACKDQLLEQDICVIQLPSYDGDGSVVINTTLFHKSGQFFSNRLVMPVVDKKAQSVGSAITYGRRYSLAALVMVTPEEDDGNAANGMNSPVQQAVNSGEVKKINKVQLKVLRGAIAIKDVTEEQIATAYGLDSLEDLPANLHDTVLKGINKKADLVEGDPSE